MELRRGPFEEPVRLPLTFAAQAGRLTVTITGRAVMREASQVPSQTIHTITASDPERLFLDLLPAFVSGAAGIQNVVVPSHTVVTLPAGAYGDIRIRDQGTLVLAGGIYDIRSLEAGIAARLIADQLALVAAW